MQASPNVTPLIMGILNVTPDSFSDGGRYLDTEKALVQVEKMVAEGAHIIDIGGESTRPGASAVSLAEERERVLSIIEAIGKRFPVRLSIDTQKFEVMAEAVGLGVTLVNDVSGGQDIRLPQLMLENPKLEVVLMHRKGTPETMQVSPVYPDGVVSEVKKFLEKRVRAFTEHEISRERIWVDPGFGFGKTTAHNLDLLRHLAIFKPIGGRLLVGTSRKSFLSKVLHEENAPMESREAGTIASCLWAHSKGASVFRVHDVGALRRALTTWEAIDSGSF